MTYISSLRVQWLALTISVCLIAVAVAGLFLVQAHAASSQTTAINVAGKVLSASAYGAPTTGLTEEQEKKWVSDVVGTETYENNCKTCHPMEVETWRNTKHFATFKLTYRTPEAKVILKNMGERSMKRAADCRQCHFTSKLKSGRVSAISGVSCESCHGPAAKWVVGHQHPGYDATKAALKWGAGKAEKADERSKRLDPAVAKGMIHSGMIYDIATNCFGCHTVPNESLVNKGKHRAGSDFDLVAWSQGEIRHNFASSAGSPEKPTNRKLTDQQKNRYYVIGAVVNLEVTLRNLSNVKEKGGDYHKAMIERANKIRKQVDEILVAAKLPALAEALKDITATIDTSTGISAQMADDLGKAGRAFAKENDGSELEAISKLIPTEYKGETFKE